MAVDGRHVKVGDAEGGDVCWCGWWGSSMDEHREVLAEQSAESDESLRSAAWWRANEPTYDGSHDEFLAWLNNGRPATEEQKRFFAYREAGYDGWLDQDSRPVDDAEQARLNASFNRQRLGDPGVDAGGGLDMPPAAEPYRPPGREGSGWTPAPLTMSDAELNAAAREWVSDCTWNEDPEDLEDLTDAEVRRGVNRHYEGGWDQFVQDTNGYDPPAAAAAGPYTAKPMGRLTGKPREGKDWVHREPYRPAHRGNASTGGTDMTNVQQVRTAIMAAHRSAEQGLGELAQAHSSLEDAQNGLRHATEGSNQAEADQAHALLAEAINKIGEAQQQVAAALQEFEGVGQRL